MSVDWNWFFTSVSQSAAALVGIFGAFIVTKILNNQTAFTENKALAKALISEAKRIADLSLHLRFDWYHENELKLSEPEFVAMMEGDKQSAVERFLMRRLKHSPYFVQSDFIHLVSSIRGAKLDREIERQRQAKLIIGTSINNLTPEEYGGINSHTPTLITSDIQHALIEERKEMDDLYTEALHHTRVIINFHANAVLNPESSAAITSSLKFVFGLFVFGVIYPLSFLPVPLNWTPTLSVYAIPSFLLSFRGGLLALIFAMFTYMLWMFYQMNSEMKYSDELLNELIEYTNLSKYSKYFGKREANEKATAEAKLQLKASIRKRRFITKP